MQSQLGNYPAAVMLLHQAISREEALYGASSPEVARTTSDLGVTLLQMGNVAAADSAEEAALSTVRGLPTPNRALEGSILGRLATGLDFAGDRSGSDSAYRAAIATLSHVLGADHPDVTWFTYNYAGSLMAWGEPKAALTEADKVLALRGKTLPDTHPMVASSLVIRGQSLGQLGDHAGAVQALREALALRRRYLAPDHWLVGSAESILGDELRAGGKRAEGIALMESGCHIILAALGTDNPKTKDAQGRLEKAGQPSTCR